MNDDQDGVRVLMFSIALNHYDVIYAANIDSHERYARRNGYCYEMVREPVWATVREAVWLKIALIEAALAAGWDWVLFIDVDCEIKSSAPPIETIGGEGGAVFLAPGFSGEFNSGVIAARLGAESRVFFTAVLDAAGDRVPEEDWGENGHIIHFAKKFSAVRRLDRRWNNNADPGLDDYIRHYSAGGPMRALYPFTLAGKATRLFVRAVGKARKFANRHDVPRAELTTRVRRLAAKVGRLNPMFGHVPGGGRASAARMRRRSDCSADRQSASP